MHARVSEIEPEAAACGGEFLDGEVLGGVVFEGDFEVAMRAVEFVVGGEGPTQTVHTSSVRSVGVGPLGFEPRTCGLRGRCSAVELEARRPGRVAVGTAPSANLPGRYGVTEGT